MSRSAMQITVCIRLGNIIPRLRFVIYIYTVVCAYTWHHTPKPFNTGSCHWPLLTAFPAFILLTRGMRHTWKNHAEEKALATYNSRSDRIEMVLFNYLTPRNSAWDCTELRSKKDYIKINREPHTLAATKSCIYRARNKIGIKMMKYNYHPLQYISAITLILYDSSYSFISAESEYTAGYRCLKREYSNIEFKHDRINF